MVTALRKVHEEQARGSLRLLVASGLLCFFQLVTRPKADIKAEDQVQKYQGYTLLHSLRTTTRALGHGKQHIYLLDQHHWEKPSWSMRALLDKSKDTASEQEPCSPSDILQSKTKITSGEAGNWQLMTGSRGESG